MRQYSKNTLWQKGVMKVICNSKKGTRLAIAQIDKTIIIEIADIIKPKPKNKTCFSFYDLWAKGNNNKCLFKNIFTPWNNRA